MSLEAIGAIAASVAAGTLVSALSEYIPSLAEKVIGLAARIQYQSQPAVAEVRREEWSALINDRASNLLKLYAALVLFLRSIVSRFKKQDIEENFYSDSSASVFRWIYARTSLVLYIGSLISVAIAINVATSDRNPIPWWIASASLVLVATLATTFRSWRAATDPLVSRLVKQADQLLQGLQGPWFDPLHFPLRVSQRLGGDYAAISTILASAEPQKRVVIVGDRGSGKTSLLYEIARQSLDRAIEDDHPRIPVLLHAAHWHTGKSLTEWLTDELSYRFRLKKSTAYALILQGGILLFLDGLSEVPHISLSRMARLLSDGLDGCRALSVVATCRTDAFDALSASMRDFVEVNVAPLTDSEVKRFLRELPPEIDPSRIERAFEANETLAQAARNPILLRLLIYALSLRNIDSSSLSDPTWVTLLLGNDLAKRGETEEALRLFGAAAGGRPSITATLADVLYGQVLAGLGRHEDAGTAFERAKSKYCLLLENLPTSSKTGLEIDEDQQKILRSLRMAVTYDDSQIASISLLPPAAVQRALSALLQAGLIVHEEERTSEEVGRTGGRWRLTDAALSEKTMR